MEIKEEIVNDVSLGALAYEIYYNCKYNSRVSKKMSAFQLKIAFTQGNLNAIQAVEGAVKLYLPTERDELTLPYCKILHFNNKKGLENTLNFMIYRAVKNNHLKNAQFLIESHANVAVTFEECVLSMHSHDLYAITNTLPTTPVEKTLLHIACFNDNPEMAALLLTAGAPAFQINCFQQTPRQINAACFDKAWLSMCADKRHKKEICCKKLGLTLYDYDALTTQAEEHLKELELAAQAKLVHTVIETIHSKYEELLKIDKEVFKFTNSQYRNFSTIREIIEHAYKNTNKQPSKVLFFIQEDRTLRALKALNYITQDNKLDKSAPEPFKKAFNEQFPPLNSEDFVLV